MALNIGDICPHHFDGVINRLYASCNLTGNYGWACSSPAYDEFDGPFHGTSGCWKQLNSRQPPVLLTQPIINGTFKIEDDHYPHKCPRCGRKCYIGMNIDHENIAAGVKCNSGL